MNSPEQDRERDNLLDAEIDALLAGDTAEYADASGAQHVAREFARLAAEESPRMSHAARAQGLNALRAGAAAKRAARRPNPFAFLLSVPRWAQIAAIALIVVLVANGISNAAADALPGSALYPFKRFGEDGQLFLQNTNGQRARVWMNLANKRLDEVQRLLARGEQVAPSALDAVDESILRSLGELAGTRGEERVQLLQQLTQLAIRQQQVVNQLAQSSAPADRARLEQTARLLQGIASYAQSADAAVGTDSSPFQFLTPSPTPQPSVTPSPTLTTTPSPTTLPTFTPTPLPTETTRPPTDVPSPIPPTRVEPTLTRVPSPRATSDANANDNDSQDNDNDNSSGNDGDNDNDNSGNDDDNNDNDDSDDNSDDDNNSGGDDDDDNDNDNSGGGNNDDNDNDNSGGGNNDDNDNDNSGGGDNNNDNDDDDNSGGGNNNDNDDDDNDNQDGDDDD